MPDSVPLTEIPSATAETYGVYRVLRPLGEGASGRVFLAERTDFAQRVALKVFRPEFVTAGLGVGLGNGQGELHLLTSLDHRHIVRVLQAGVTPAGVRYFAMEYVDGEDLLTHADTRRLPLAGRVRLLLQVLEAVGYAHRHLVIHGDLKPANILVTAEGEARLVDFGSAVRLAVPGEDETTTAHTPAFASPEQRAGARTTVASDIYSLGLVARLLLAGIPPGSTAAELPSRAVTTDAAEARAATPAQLAARLRGDLDAILLKALEPSPEARYATAEAMAGDLRAFLEGRTPAVRQAPVAERLRKWVLRHRLGAAMAALLLATLLFSATGVAVKAAQASRSRREAQARLRELVALTGTLQTELYGSVRGLPNAGASEKLLTDSAAATLDRLAASDPTDPTLRSELASQYAQLARLELEQAQGTAPAAAVEHLRVSLTLTAPDDPQRAERVRLLAMLRPAGHVARNSVAR